MKVSIRPLLIEKFCLRDPHQTELGQKILNQGIHLIDQLGIEAFTFKKLATEIGSTEASIYRYFENKHKLLVYLVAWYWAWLQFVIDYQIHNVQEGRKRLRLALEALASANTNDPRTKHIQEGVLHRIVVAESSKAFLTKNIDGEHEEGLFQGYINLVEKIASIFLEVNPHYTHPKALAVTVIETSRKQLFFVEHIPAVTELSMGGSVKNNVADFLENLVLKCLEG